MFTTSTMQDAFDKSQKLFKALPKTPEETKVVLEKVKNVYTKEAKKAAEVVRLTKRQLPATHHRMKLPLQISRQKV